MLVQRVLVLVCNCTARCRSRSRREPSRIEPHRMSCVGFLVAVKGTTTTTMTMRSPGWWRRTVLLACLKSQYSFALLAPLVAVCLPSSEARVALCDSQIYSVDSTRCKDADEWLCRKSRWPHPAAADCQLGYCSGYGAGELLVGAVAASAVGAVVVVFVSSTANPGCSQGPGCCCWLPRSRSLLESSLLLLLLFCCNKAGALGKYRESPLDPPEQGSLCARTQSTSAWTAPGNRGSAAHDINQMSGRSFPLWRVLAARERVCQQS